MSTPNESAVIEVMIILGVAVLIIVFLKEVIEETKCIL
jgi:hypothetical protein